MKKPNFIKLIADNDIGELVDITLNTSKIHHYVTTTKDGNETKCCITVSSHIGGGSDFLYVMETKEDLDKILT